MVPPRFRCARTTLGLARPEIAFTHDLSAFGSFSWPTTLPDGAEGHVFFQRLDSSNGETPGSSSFERIIPGTISKNFRASVYFYHGNPGTSDGYMAGN